MSDQGARPRIGLIAGAGELPLLVARGMRARGIEVRAIGLAGQYDERLPAECDRFHQVGLFRLGGWARRLKRLGVEQAVMVGGVDKARLMHDRLRLLRRIPDWATIVLWYRRLRHDRRSATILTAIAEQLGERGVQLIDSTTHIPEHLAQAGVMTRRRPSESEAAAIRFGWPLFRQTLSLHVGQAMAVREGDVLAVEAAEGTDRMIARAGELCRAGGWVLLKGAPPDHDRRADVPTIGERTIRNAHAAGCRCLALGAGDVILVDKPAVLATAEELGVSVVGIGSDAEAQDF